MVPATFLLLAPVVMQGGADPAAQPGRSQAVQVRAAASAEVLRSGQIGGIPDRESVRVKPRTTSDGRVLWEFR